MSDTMLGWWFSEGMTLPHGDDRQIAVGQTHSVSGDIIPCQNGLHMSDKPLDALHYATGNLVWRVRGRGVGVRDKDKAAWSHRTYLAGGIDVSDTLYHFARLCALDVISLWDAPDVVRRYLRTGNTNLRAAARGAARGAARDAARGAARDAAWDACAACAARDAACAARDAAWAAGDAAPGAARAAA